MLYLITKHWLLLYGRCGVRADTSGVAALSFSMATPTTASAEGGTDKAGGDGSCSHVDLI